MWPGFDFLTVRHMWVEFVVGSHRWFECLVFFLPVSSLRKSKHSKIQFDLEKMDEEQPTASYATDKYNLFIVIYINHLLTFF